MARVVADNVRLVCARRRVTQVDLAEVLRMSKMSVSDRFRYVTAWTLDDLEILRDFLGVPISVLTGEALSAYGETDHSGPLLVAETRKATRNGPPAIGHTLPLGTWSAAG